MSNVQSFNLTFTDLFNVAYATEPAFKAIDDDGNVVIFCPNHTMNRINEYEARYKNLNDKELKENGIKATALEFKKQCDAMRDIVNHLDAEMMIKILECLPRLANKSIRSTTLPVYMTGITEYEGEAGSWCRVTSVELAVEPWVVPAPLTNDPASIWAPSTKIKNTFMFDFCCTREYDKKDVPVINQDRTFNQVEYKRNSYIPMDKLIRGHIYTDKKDREFLYLGVIRYASAQDFVGYACNGRPIIDYNVDTLEDDMCKPNRPYVFLSLNAKRKRELSNAATFQEWIENEIRKTMTAKPKDDNLVYPYWPSYFKLTAKSFKVTTDCGELFSLENLLCNIDITVGEKLTPDEVKERGFETTAHARARTIFDVIDKIPIMQYTVRENCLNWRRATVLLETTDAKEAKTFMKEYFTKHPDRASNTVIGKKDDDIFIFMEDEIIATDPN